MKKLIHIDSGPIGSLALISLYESYEFSKSSFQIYSFAYNKIIVSVNTYHEVIDILSNKKYIVCATVNNTIEIFLEFIRVYIISTGSGNIAGFKITMALSESFLAYSLKETDENRLFLASEIMSLAEDSCNAILSIVGQENLITFPYQNNNISILDLSTNTKLQEIHAFPVSISKLGFSTTGNLLFVSPKNSHSFHVYRLEDEYKLIYKLHRGISNAEIINLNFSFDENWIVATSSRGTSHLYNINPKTKTLVYNHAVFDRIKNFDAVCCYLFSGTPSKILFFCKTGLLSLKKLGCYRKIANIQRFINFSSKKMSLRDWKDMPEELV